MAIGQVFAGMMRRDGGKAWRPMARGTPEDRHAPCITNDGSRTHAGARQGPHVSTGNGEHWQRLGFTDQFHGIAGHPDADPNAGVSMAEGVKEMAE